MEGNVLHILVLEDQKIDYDRVSLALERSGGVYELTWVRRGEEAIEQLAKKPIDVILLDIQLPGTNGLELLTEMQRRHIEIPVIFITGNGNEQLAADALTLGVQEYLVKDSTTEYLKLLPAVVQKAYQQLQEKQARQKAESERDHFFDISRRWDTLYRVSEVISSNLDPELVYEAIHRAVKQLMPCDAFVISLLHEDDEEIEFAYLSERGRRIDPMRVPAETGLSGHVIATGKVLRTGDFNPAAMNITPVRFGGIRHVPSVLAVPLRRGQKVVGMLAAQSYHPYAYTRDEQSVLETLANQAAVAIENARLFAALRANHEHMHDLAQQIVTTQELEEKRFAQEIHDGVGQKITMLKLSLQLLRRRLPSSAQPRMEEVISLSDTILNDIRLMTHGLQPPILGSGMFEPALKSLCYEFSNFTGLVVQFRRHGEKVPDDISENAGITFYRVLQEGLNNAARHSAASQIQVTLTYTTGELRLAISDNGRGFDLQEARSELSIGLSGMEERLEILGGHLKIETELQKGTCLTAWLPLVGNDTV